MINKKLSTQKKGLCVLQWNCKGINSENHGSELKTFLNKCIPKPDIICLQETWLGLTKKARKNASAKKDFQIPGYQSYFIHSRPRGGLATFIKNNIPHDTITYKELHEGLEVLGHTITNDKQTIDIINVYISPNTNQAKLVAGDYNKLIKQNKNVIIVGDLNCHNSLWGSSRNSPQGLNVEEFINNNHLICLNDGSETFISDINLGTSAIDLTISSPNIGANSQWQVINTLNSDHLPIITNYNNHITYQEQDIFKPKWKFNKADWSGFYQQCKKLNKTEDNDVNIFNKNLTKEIINISEKYIPKTRKNNDRQNVPWWNQDIENECTKRNRFRKIYKITKNPKYHELYKLAKANVTKIIKQAKQYSWESFCSEINQHTPIRDMWNKIKRIQGTRSSTNILTTHRTAKTSKSKANLLSEVFGKNSSNENFPQKFKEKHSSKDIKEQNHINFRPPNKNNNDDQEYNIPLTLNELKTAIKNKKSAATGPDQISYTFLKHMPDEALNTVLKLFNLIWSTSTIPEEWKNAECFALPKPGKNHSDPNNYRPITLTSHLCKTLETIINTRLNKFLNDNNLINRFQSGFRANHSTVDQIIRLQTSINHAFHKSYKAVGVFVDINKAFDMVHKSGLLEKIEQKGITGNMYNFINEFIHNRSIIVQVKGHKSQETKIENGIPQGSVISPTLFNIFINDITDYLNKQDSKKKLKDKLNTALFADDCAFWRTGRQLPHLIKQIQIDLNNLNDWANMWGIKLSLTKTVGIIFSLHKKGCKTNELNLKIGNDTLKQVREVKFLGVTFDSELTFNKHISNIVESTKKTLNLLKAIKSTNWGASTKSMLMVYNACIRSRLDYGAQVFCCASDIALKKLQTIQYQALRLIGQALPNTPGNSLEVEYNIMPLNYRRKLQMLKYNLKINALQTNHPVQDLTPRIEVTTGVPYKLHAIIKNSFATEVSKIELETNTHDILLANKLPIKASNSQTPFKVKTQTDKVENPDFKKVMFQITANEHYHNHTHIYTDGSKNPDNGKVGYAFIAENIGNQPIKIENGRLPNKLSIYTAEMIAIIKAMEWIIDNNIYNSVIFSDSLSSIMSIQSAKSSRPDLLSRFQELQDIIHKKNLHLIFEWVPAHINIKGNELADKYAKMSLDINEKDIQNHIPMGINEIVSIANKYYINEWQKDWNASDNIWYKNIKPIVNSIKPNINNPKSEKIINRLRIGISLEVRGTNHITTNNKCPCGIIEDMKHYLLDCPKHKTQRDQLIKTIKEHNPSFTFNAANILNPTKNNKEICHTAVVQFVLDTKPKL